MSGMYYSQDIRDILDNYKDKIEQKDFVDIGLMLDDLLKIETNRTAELEKQSEHYQPVVSALMTIASFVKKTNDDAASGGDF